jgi:6-phosphogluconolactonase
MGPDGHVASLFPGSCALRERSRYAVAAYADRLHSWRITLTFPVILAARRVLMLVAGAPKAEMVREALGARPPEKGAVPARRLLEHAAAEWHLDREAAHLWQEDSA